MAPGSGPARPVPGPKPPLITWDVVLSVVLLVLAALLVAFGVLFGIFSVAFLDYCPPDRCSAGGAFAAVGIALLVAVVIVIAGLVFTILRIMRRRISWPFAAGALVLCALALLGGAGGYGLAVGPEVAEAAIVIVGGDRGGCGAAGPETVITVWSGRPAAQGSPLAV
jgi:hypothetical protein